MTMPPLDDPRAELLVTSERLREAEDLAVGDAGRPSTPESEESQADPLAHAVGAPPTSPVAAQERAAENGGLTTGAGPIPSGLAGKSEPETGSMRMPAAAPPAAPAETQDFQAWSAGPLPVRDIDEVAEQTLPARLLASLRRYPLAVAAVALLVAVLVVRWRHAR